VAPSEAGILEGGGKRNLKAGHARIIASTAIVCNKDASTDGDVWEDGLPRPSSGKMTVRGSIARFYSGFLVRLRAPLEQAHV
jgi:hypothetical protein